MEAHDLTTRANFFKTLALLAFAGCALPWTLAAAVPDGYVVRADSPTVYLDWGKSAGVQPGDRFRIYRTGPELKHPVTGDVLGHEELSVAEGSIDRVEDKFSTGRLYQAALAPEAGDRTRYEESAASAAVVSSAAVSGSLTPAIPALTELWRSDPLPDEIIGLAVGNVEGDGSQELVAVTADKIQLYKITDKKLTLVAIYQARLYKHWLNVETGDPGQLGHDDIFATVWQDSYHRPRVVVLRWQSGALKPVGDFDGFVRSIRRADGSRALIWQTISRGREKSYAAPALLTLNKTTYKPGTALSLSHWRDDQLFGFTLGDWDRDKVEDLAILQDGERLQVFLKDNKWKASETYGGTKNTFITDDQGSQVSFPPRLISWPAVAGAEELIVPHNISELGFQLGRLKLYKKSEITGLAWNGSEMAPNWQQPLDGYLADLAMGDGLNESSMQLWVAAIASGGKTILLAYRLP